MAPSSIFLVLAHRAARRCAAPALVLGAALLLGTGAPSRAQICPPAPGVPIPPIVEEVRGRRLDAFAMRRAWIQKTRRLASARHDPARAGKIGSAVEGVLRAPVFPVLYANSPQIPFDPPDLESRLFGAGPGTVTAYYQEVSGGRLQVEGDVFGWYALPEDDTYYAGTSRGLNPDDARTGELLRDTLLAYDASIDFGQFDNDGLDGVPNSGDDDGYVDFVAFVHPEAGAECGGNENLWSHRWVYTAWNASGGIPFVTDDVSLSGGPILIDDYTVQPGLDCDGASMVEVGIFCHEFGHVFGLPDLYDIDGGGQGLGFWGLMASGNWNTPDSPAHMSAWTKQQLGWVDTIVVPWAGLNLTLASVMDEPVVIEFSWPRERWRRRQDCALAGEASLAAGLLSGEAVARGWLGGAGYGNGWRETVAHDFPFDGTGPVILGYEYAVDTESGYDFAFVLLEIEGVESIVAVYGGQTQGVATHDLTPRLGATPTEYRIKLRLASNGSRSHEDGAMAGGCAPFVVDHVWVQGGGAAYFADFEAHRQGWYTPRNPQDNPHPERWLLEHRRRAGFDQHLPGEGLLLYHVDDQVAWSASGNTGGVTGTLTRGVVLEEADGRFDLNTPDGNRGDGGDVWPGSTSAVTFDLFTVPSAHANGGDATRVAVRSIQSQADRILCTVEGGEPPPRVEGIFPDFAAEAETSVTLELLGAGDVQHDARILLRRSNQPDAEGLADWQDAHVVSAVFDVSSLPVGRYDVVVENPDGQTAWLAAAFTRWGEATVGPPAATPAVTVLHANAPNPFNPRTLLRYELAESDWVELIVLDLRGRRVRTLLARRQEAGFHDVVWDGTDEAGRPVASGLYFARLETSNVALQRKMLLAR